jgi:Tfp pilus assembly protein PilF
MAYYMKDDYVHAHADWEQALRIDPNNALVRDFMKMLQGH